MAQVLNELLTTLDG